MKTGEAEPRCRTAIERTGSARGGPENALDREEYPSDSLDSPPPPDPELDRTQELVEQLSTGLEVSEKLRTARERPEELPVLREVGGGAGPCRGRALSCSALSRGGPHPRLALQVACKYRRLNVEDEPYYHGLVRSIDTAVMLTQERAFLVHLTTYSDQQVRAGGGRGRPSATSCPSAGNTRCSTW